MIELTYLFAVVKACQW